MCQRKGISVYQWERERKGRERKKREREFINRLEF
jgi:hypothetical protein